MNKNKLIFLGMIGVIGFFIFLLFLVMNSRSPEKSQKSELEIWTLGHTPEDFSSLTEKYVTDSGNISTFFHRNFESYGDYSEALKYELMNSDGPDIFMLNNSEPLFLEERISGIDPKYINPENFRKNFLSPFPEEMIQTIDDNGEKIDFLIGVPAGFETLGLYYDRRSFIGQNLESWAGVAEAIKDIKEKNGRVTPLGIGHGTTVHNSQDIFTQFLINNGSRSIFDFDSSSLKRSLAAYYLYADDDGDNQYNRISERLEEIGKNNISLFSTGEIKMLIGFPSILKEIKESGFSKSYLSAEPFPKSNGNQDKLLVNYNYFVINSKSNKGAEASQFLSYLASETGAEKYYSIFTERLPAHALLTQNLDQKFDEDFNIRYKHVLRDQIELVSYNKGIKYLYDMQIPIMLNNEILAEKLLERLQGILSCKMQILNGDSNKNPNCNK